LQGRKINIYTHTDYYPIKGIKPKLLEQIRVQTITAKEPKKLTSIGWKVGRVLRLSECLNLRVKYIYMEWC